MGISRTRLYSKILQTSTITHQSSLTCAADVYVWLRVVAALWPPVVQVAMGFDKAACVLVPIWYRRYLEGRNGRLYPFTIVFVGLSLAVALMLAVIHEGKPVSYYCGRKAAFTADYGRFLYFNEIFGYFFGLLSNATAYLFAGRILQTSAMKRYLAKSRYTLVISLLSSILVACPNILSVIMSQTHKKLPMAVSESAQWLSLANSSKNLFVYVAMSAEFRGRVFVIIGMRRKLLLSHSGNAVAPSANDFIHPAIIVLRKHMSVPKPPDKGRGIAVQ
ncbi:unnamed protein product [Toxocara canis]|uniref:G_PROTEIN_RECEP_F1_2 domain-containing protein n=1 Tax=Toxocara canis TaxID=6265 RepID=A0A183V0J5_TOXCA|nr:unnamed protein product [Toxocara canis]